MKKTLLLACLATAAVQLALPARAMPIIVDGNRLSDILDSVTLGGETSIDVNADQFLEGDDWSIPEDDESEGVAIFTGDVTPSLSRVSDRPLTFGVYDSTDSGKRVGLLVTGDPEGQPFVLEVAEDGTVRVDGNMTGVSFAGNRFGFYLTDGVTTRYSDWHLNPEMGVHAVFFAGNGDILEVEGFPPTPFGPGQWFIAWEFGDLADDTRLFDDFVVLIRTVGPYVGPVPEPGALALLAIGLIAIGFAMKRRSRDS